MTMGSQMRILREMKKLTQEQMSSKFGIKRARYCSWENSYAIPNILMIVRIAQFFEVSTDFLLGCTTPQNTSDIGIISNSILLSFRKTDSFKAVLSSFVEEEMHFRCNPDRLEIEVFREKV